MFLLCCRCGIKCFIMTWDQVSLRVAEGSTTCRFMDAVTIWRQKPHVINRRLCGSELVWSEKLLFQPAHVKDFNIARLVLQAAVSKLPIDFETIAQFIREEFCRYGQLLGDTLHCVSGQHGELNVTLRLLVPKQSARFRKVLELVVTDARQVSVLFAPVGVFLSEGDTTLSKTNDIVYMISYSPENFSLFLHVWTGNEGESVSSGLEESSAGTNGGITWLSDTLLTKLARWSREPQLNTEILSLRLVSVQQYSAMYEQLKDKYGRYFVEIWTENTDPQKFVYEDIGIAAYLLVLWHEEKRVKGLTQKQSFIDLGCGNGLLVYILSSEGHPGIGVDIRRRKIWDILGAVANLKEQTVVPSDSMSFPEYDWLIGNHSDELTPWIPFMAARSHYGCRYFVLPCCAWDFTSKFADNTPGTSQYRVYLNYVRLVGETCGFRVREDVLRIPSTKRVCFIGMDRSYPIEEEPALEVRRLQLLRERCSSSKRGVGCEDVVSSDEQIPSSWASDFKPRPAVEKQKNAVTIDRSVKEFITTTVFHKLLAVAVSLIEIRCGQTWNKGGSLSLCEIGSMFDKNILTQLKSECGGIQTVLKNCADVFFVNNGSVTIRDWTSSEYLVYRESRRKKLKNGDSASQRLKTSLCFFEAHHPDGCPLLSEHCRFAHGSQDLRRDNRQFK